MSYKMLTPEEKACSGLTTPLLVINEAKIKLSEWACCGGIVGGGHRKGCRAPSRESVQREVHSSYGHAISNMQWLLADQVRRACKGQKTLIHRVGRVACLIPCT